MLASTPRISGGSASGGQTTITKVVASSGGDYTTLAAALAAASAGWVIYIAPGTYTETTVSSSLDNISILGGGAEATVLTYGTASLTLTGNKWIIDGIKMTFSTGTFTANTGTNQTMRNVTINKTGTNNGVVFGTNGTPANNGLVQNCTFNDTSTYTGDYRSSFKGDQLIIEGCNFNTLTNISNQGTIRIAGVNYGMVTITGCSFIRTGGTATNPRLVEVGAYTDIAGCSFYDPSGVCELLEMDNGGATVAGCTFQGGKIQIDCISAHSVITGNYFKLTANSTTSVLVGANNVSCVGNALHAPSSTGTVAFDGTTTPSNYCTYSGNAIHEHITAFSIAGIHNIITGNIWDNTTTTTGINDTGTVNAYTDNIGAPITQERKLIRMKNNSGGSLAAGDVVILDGSVAAGDNVTTTTTASDNRILGVADEAINSAAYGFICVAGKMTTLKADGTTDIAVGDFLTTFTSAKIARKAAAGTLGTTPGDMAFAVALEAYTANDSAGVLDALIIQPRRL